MVKKRLNHAVSLAFLLLLAVFILPAFAQNNQPPQAMIVAPGSGFAGKVIIFDSGDSHDPDGSIEFYIWDFGDDEATVRSSLGDSTVAHIYDSPGTYQVSLTVIDNGGLSTTATHTIVIEALVLDNWVYLPYLMLFEN